MRKYVFRITSFTFYRNLLVGSELDNSLRKIRPWSLDVVVL